MGREEIRAPLQTPAWEATIASSPSSPLFTTEMRFLDWVHVMPSSELCSLPSSPSSPLSSCLALGACNVIELPDV